MSAGSSAGGINGEEMQWRRNGGENESL